MNKTQIALIVTATSTVLLGAKLLQRTHQVNVLAANYGKLRAWSGFAQRVMAESFDLHPEIVSELSDDLKADIAFYDLMSKENLV